MSWGEVELEPEVVDWYSSLTEGEQARVGFHVDRLADQGPLLDEPHTKQLDASCASFGSTSVAAPPASPTGSRRAE